MSASLIQSLDLMRTAEAEEEGLQGKSLPRSVGWNLENYERKQIDGLVRRVFFSDTVRPVRQVVFSAVDRETDVRSICRRVGEALALETTETVAVMGGCLRLLREVEGQKEDGTRPGNLPPLRRIAAKVRGNLWLVPAAGGDRGPVPTASLHSYLGELRREFEYSIVEGPPAGEANETTAMAQFADGIILVLAAQQTRRIAALRIKETLEGVHARLLGTVLSDRVFPIPEGIYRRL